MSIVNHINDNLSMGIQILYEKNNFLHFDLRFNQPKTGGIIIKQHPPCSYVKHIALIENTTLIETIFYYPTIPIHLMNGFVNAGWYAHSCGYLPYSFSKKELDFLMFTRLNKKE